ncbi:MAG: hypothetical protein AAB309_05465 [Deltaproteobacteria bacterium]
MRKKHAKIIIRSVDNLKTEWKQALKGKKKAIQKEEDIILTNLETMAKVFSRPRMEILRVIIHHKPSSIYALAKLVHRDFKNVHMDVKLLVDIGLVELKESKDGRKGLILIAKFSGIDLDLAA